MDKSGDDLVDVVRPQQRVFRVSKVSMVIALIMMCISMVYILYYKVTNKTYYKDPVATVNFFISLVAFPLSMYEFLISMMVFSVTRKPMHNRQSMSSLSPTIWFQKTYIVSVWYISHLSMLPVYWMLLIIELVVCISWKHWTLLGIFTAFMIAYQGESGAN